MAVLTDLEAFAQAHRPHGQLRAETTEPAWNDYLVTVSCPCGVVFERWVTPREAGEDLRRSTLRTASN